MYCYQCVRGGVAGCYPRGLHLHCWMQVNPIMRQTGPVVHLHLKDCSEELLRRQQYYAIKNQRGARKIGGIFHSKAPPLDAQAGSLWHKTADTSNSMNLSTNESRALTFLDQ